MYGGDFHPHNLSSERLPLNSHEIRSLNHCKEKIPGAPLRYAARFHPWKFFRISGT